MTSPITLLNTSAATHISATIIIPTHNRLPTLNRALTSAKDQTHPNTEIIVIDDASTDGTSQWLQTHHRDVKLIQLEENRGAAAASNIGIEQAQGQYIAFLDSDDRWHPNYLATQIKALEQHTGAILAYSDYYAHYTGTEEREHIQLQPEHPDLTFCFLFGSFIHSCSLVTIRSDILRQVGGFNPNLRTSYDKDLYLRLVKLGDFVRTPRPLVDKYWTPGSLVTADNCERWRKADLEVVDLFLSQPENARYRKHRVTIEKLLHRRIDQSQQFFAKTLAAHTGDSTDSIDSTGPTVQRPKLPQTIHPAPRYNPAPDLWLLTSYFNPGRYRSKYLNYQQFKLRIQASGLKLITVECALPEQSFELAATGDVIQVRAQTALWQKERLLNLALKHLPDEAKKIAWLDSDILFNNPDWAKQTAALLDDYPVVQPYAHSIRLLAGQTHFSGEAEVIQPSFAHIYQKHPERVTQGSCQTHGQTGYGWAARRDIIERCGLYDSAILGSADLYMAHAFCGDWESSIIDQELGSDTHRRQHFTQWAKTVHAEVQGKIGCVPGVVLHLWHGSMNNRRYEQRQTPLNQHQFDPTQDLQVSSEGTWAWASDKPELHQAVAQYFQQRQEDSHG